MRASLARRGQGLPFTVPSSDYSRKTLTMRVTDTQEIEDGLLATLLANESFWPATPRSIEETGLTESFIESLITKYLGVSGTSSGRNIAEEICLPFGILESLFASLRTRQ